MPEHELYNTRTPGDAITVVPTSLEYVFDAPKGEDIFGVVCGDNRLGHFILCLTPSVAAHIIAHLLRCSPISTTCESRPNEKENNMSDQPDEPGTAADTADSAAAETPDADTEQHMVTVDSEHADTVPGREAAKWRTKLREVEAERDSLVGKVEALQRAQVDAPRHRARHQTGGRVGIRRSTV